MIVHSLGGYQGKSSRSKKCLAPTASKVQLNFNRRNLQKTRQTKSKIHRPLTSRQFSLSSQVSPTGHLRYQAMSAAYNGNFVEAIALLSQLIQQNPTNAAHYNNRGLVYFQNHQLEQAIADFNAALALDPKLGNVYNNRANLYAAQGQLAEAIADYTTAIDFNPANIRAWINQGITFRDLEIYNQAIENFDLALQLIQQGFGSESELQPNSYLKGHIYAERGRTYQLLGDWNFAIADYQRALKQLPEPKTSSSNPSQRLSIQVRKWLEKLVRPLAQ